MRFNPGPLALLATSLATVQWLIGQWIEILGQKFYKEILSLLVGSTLDRDWLIYLLKIAVNQEMPIEASVGKFRNRTEEAKLQIPAALVYWPSLKWQLRFECSHLGHPGPHFWNFLIQMTKSGVPVSDLEAPANQKLPFEMVWIFTDPENKAEVPGQWFFIVWSWHPGVGYREHSSR